MKTALLRPRDMPEWAGLSLVWAILAGLILPWHAVNAQVPIWDGANFVENVLKILERFDTGFLAGLHGVYEVRGWRPISFPAFCVPFFAVAGGKIIPGVALSLTAAALLTATYVFRLLCTTLSVPRAVLGTVTVCTLPWFGKYSTSFMSELLWLGMTAGWLFHLLEGFRTGRVRHFVFAGLWLGGMSTVRPIETALSCAVPVFASLLIGVRKRMVTVADVGLVLALTGGVVLAGWLWGAGIGGRWRWVLVVVLLAIGGYRARRIFLERPLLASVVVALGVGMAWFLPFFPVLYAWAYDTSVGDLARLTDRRLAGASIDTAVTQTLAYYSPGVLAILATLTTLAYIRGASETNADSPRFRALLVGLSMLPVMFALLLYTGTGDPRRIMAGMIVVVTGCVLAILAPGGLFPRLRSAALGVLCLILYGATLSNNLAFGIVPLARFDTLTAGMLPPVKDADRNVVIAEGLLRLVERGSIAAHTHCYRAPQARCTERGVAWFDPHAVNTLLQERGSRVRVHFTGAAIDFADPASIRGWLAAEGFDHVLVDELPLQPGLNTEDPYVINTEGFVRLLANLPPVLHEVGTIDFHGRRLRLLAVRPSEDRQ